MIGLPAGFTAAPLADDDVDAVVTLVRACEVHDLGRAMYERADLVGDLATEHVDRAHDAVVVRDAAGAVVAWGLVVHRRSRWADVHPRVRGRGIGSVLVDWSVQRARAHGADRVGQTVADCRADAVALLRAKGARAVRTAWILRSRHDADRPAPTAVVPDGMVLRAAAPAEQDEALLVLERAFAQWPDRPASSLQTWRALVTHREGFRAEQLQVAILDGRVAGAAFLIDDGAELWVDKLGTDPAYRHRGVGRALLGSAQARAHALGRSGTALSTESSTGALGFYERLGMVVDESFTHWAIPLG